MKEISTSVGVVGFSNNFIKKKSIKRKKFMNQKTKKENINRNIHRFVRNSIFDILLEQDEIDKTKSLVSVLDNFSKRIDLSLGYSRQFVIDSLKLSDKEAVEFNAKRAKTELTHIENMIDDMKSLIDKIYSQHVNKEKQ